MPSEFYKEPEMGIAGIVDEFYGRENVLSSLTICVTAEVSFYYV